MDSHTLACTLRGDYQATCNLLANLARNYPQQLLGLESYVFLEPSEASVLSLSPSTVFGDLSLRFSTLSDAQILQFNQVFSSVVVNPQQYSQIAQSLLSGEKAPLLKSVAHIRLLRDLLVRYREMSAIFRLISASGAYSLSPTTPSRVDATPLLKSPASSSSSSSSTPPGIASRLSEEQLARALENLQVVVRQLSYTQLTDLRNDLIISNVNASLQDRLSQLSSLLHLPGDYSDCSSFLLTLVSGINNDDMLLCDSALHDFNSVQLFQVVKLQSIAEVALYELQNILGVTPASFNVDKFTPDDHGSPTMPFMLSPTEQDGIEPNSAGVMGLPDPFRGPAFLDETVLNSDPVTIGQYTDKISLFGNPRNDTVYVSPQALTGGGQVDVKEEMSDGDFFFDQNLRSDDSSTDSHSTMEDHHSPDPPGSTIIQLNEAPTAVTAAAAAAAAAVSDNPDGSPMLKIVEQPPDMCVYKRNIKPMPSVRICCDSLDDVQNCCVVPMMYRCDTNNNETQHLSGREFCSATPGGIAEFKKLRILMTSRMLSDSLLILVFELRHYKRINPVNSYLAINTIPPTNKKGEPQMPLADLSGTTIPGDDGSERPVTMEDLDNPQEYEVLHTVISSPITVVSHSTQLRSSEASKRDPTTSSSASPSPGGGFLQSITEDDPRIEGCSVSEVIPCSGPFTGGTRVAVLGKNFSNTTSIRVCFGEIEIVPTVLGQRTLVCVTPPHAPGSVPVRVKSDDVPSSMMSRDPLFTFE